jgi:hypothetical protein
MAEKVCTQSRSLETARLRGVSATKDPKASCDRQMQKDEVDEVPNTTISSGTRPKELLGKEGSHGVPSKTSQNSSDDHTGDNLRMHKFEEELMYIKERVGKLEENGNTATQPKPQSGVDYRSECGMPEDSTAPLLAVPVPESCVDQRDQRGYQYYMREDSMQV